MKNDLLNYGADHTERKHDAKAGLIGCFFIVAILSVIIFAFVLCFQYKQMSLMKGQIESKDTTIKDLKLRNESLESGYYPENAK